MALIFEMLDPATSQSCYQIHQSGQYNPWSKAIFDDCLSKPYFASRMSEGDCTLGYYIGMAVLDEATLMDIAVGERHQRQGFGRVLIEHFIQYCQDHGLTQVWLEVRESNAPAINLYKNIGFQLIEQRKNYYPSKAGKEGALVMKLEL